MVEIQRSKHSIQNMETTFFKTVCKPVTVPAEIESESVTYNVSNTTAIKVHSTGLWIMFRFDNLKDIKILPSNFSSS